MLVRHPAAESITAITPQVSRQRNRSVCTIIVRRSKRSVKAPAGKVNNSQGNRWAKATSEIRNGSLVITLASHGKASAEIPSPRLEIALAENSSR